MMMINETRNGKVFQCKDCSRIHIEFLNLNFNLSPGQFRQFSKYIHNLDGEHWQNLNLRCMFQRKIVIPIGHQSFNILLHKHELEELKQLINPKNKCCYSVKVDLKDVERNFSLN